MGCHVGFQKEAPECVAWSGSSYIEPVLPIEECSNRYFSTACYLAILLFFVLGGICIFLLGPLGKRYPDSVFEPLSTYLPLVFFTTATILTFIVGYFVKRVAILKIKRRSGLLFEPGPNSFFVQIEDALTYDKRKLFVEDSGLLDIGDGVIMLETDGYRAHLKMTDVNVSLLHTSKNSAGVRLSVNHDHYPWSVVITPIGNFGILTEKSSVKKANLLLEKLREAGVCGAENTRQPNIIAKPESSVAPAAFEGCFDSRRSPEEFVVSTTANCVEDDITEKRYRDIAEILEQNKKQKKSWLKTVGILVISLLVFLQLGFLSWGLESVLLILLVLIVHEMGHYIGMKMFGYKNVKMFFIPMLGAAVSGHSRNTASWKKALVTLMGPLPGILISLVLFVVFLITGSEICYKVGMMFLFINLLNLLPIFPLDGGRFLHEVLFSRNRYIEMVVNIITAGVLLIAAVATKSWFLGLLGFINIGGLTAKFKLAGKCREMKEELLGDPMNAELLAADEDNIPEHVMKHMINWIHQHMPGAMGHKNVAATVQQMWDRIRIAPPGVGATVGLIAIFMVGYFVSFLSCGVLAVSYFKNMGKTEIVEFVDPNGATRYIEQSYMFGEVWEETQLSDDKQFYHGSYKEYYEDGSVLCEGQWDMGIHVGVWKYYDDDGEVYEEEHYKDGKIVLQRSMLEDGKWQEESWDDFSSETKKFYGENADFKYGPGKFPDFLHSENDSDYTSEFD